jgi:hypothetical protein
MTAIPNSATHECVWRTCSYCSNCWDHSAPYTEWMGNPMPPPHISTLPSRIGRNCACSNCGPGSPAETESFRKERAEREEKTRKREGQARAEKTKLERGDPRLRKLSRRACYSRIRIFLKSDASTPIQLPINWESLQEIIRHLPPASTASETDMDWLFRAILTGPLEIWHSMEPSPGIATSAYAYAGIKRRYGGVGFLSRDFEESANRSQLNRILNR